MTAPLDLVGVGIGPFNLALAALAEPLPGLRTRFLDRRPAFRWHPGMLLDGTTLQVPFLADLVTMVDPTSRWSFLNYLREHDRLFPFYFAERFHVPRREYDAYCRWVAESLPSCRFGSDVEAVRWHAEADDADGGWFELTVRTSDGTELVAARNVVLGLGTEPVLPPALAAVAGGRVFNSADYLPNRRDVLAARHVTVLGSGQSGAEVVLDLLRAQQTGDGSPASGPALAWVTRSSAFAPMEYSKLGLEHFTPDYTRYFTGLPETTRRRLVPAQWQLYKAASGDTLAEVFDALYERGIDDVPAPPVTLLPGTEVVAARPGADGLELSLHHRDTGATATLATDVVVAATGYRPVAPTLLGPLEPEAARDGHRLQVDDACRVRLDPSVGGAVYVQNGDPTTAGVGTPDLGLGAHRAATILADLAARAGRPSPYRLPRRTAFTSFGVPDGARLGLGGAA